MTKHTFDPDLFPFESRQLALKNGARIHYVDEGSGPTLVLLHGNPTSSFLYRNIILGLRDKFRLVALDYPGFGLSSAPAGYGFTAQEQADATAEFVETLGLMDFAIMMQDWGGPIGFALAQRYPDRVSGFIISNTWAWPLERWGQKAFSMFVGGLPGRALAWCCNGVVRFFMRKGVNARLPSHIYDQYLDVFSQRSSRRQTVVFPRELRAAAPFLSGVYGKFSMLSDKPALILWGKKDFAFQSAERASFEHLFPHHQTVLLPDAGHFTQEDAPDEIVAAIVKWYQR